ncbi:UDP-2,3-diacylglucosamine diphosphatase [Cereibacter sp. SYSU M97828]|nr:UDP-2,3-diacylglucosamine diphosphatase [Cereibacter flavus]
MISIAFPQGSVAARMPQGFRTETPPRLWAAPRAAPARHYRALFLSDLHLGARACRAEMLLDFLRSVTADRIYLVGDVFDFCRYREPYWTETHEGVLDALAAMGARLTRLPGNHDRQRTESGPAGRIAIGPETLVHRTATGHRYLVLHGDCAESRIGRSTVVARMGSYIDYRAQTLDAALLRRGLSGRAHRAIRWGDTLISRNVTMRSRLARMARAGGFDGIICGHLHEPLLQRDHGLTYANCGDWINSMTAVAEERDGALALIDWQGRSVSRLTVSPLTAELLPA